MWRTLTINFRKWYYIKKYQGVYCMKNKDVEVPSPNVIFPNEYKTSCYIKNVVKAPNISIGDYTYYDDDVAPTEFERNNVLFNYPEFGDKLIIGKFC